MHISTLLKNISFMKHALILVPGLDAGVPQGDGDASEHYPDVRMGQEKIQMTHFAMPNNFSSLECALKTVPGLADVGVSMGLGMAL